MTDKEALKIVDESIEEGKIVQEAFDYSFFYTVKEALEKQIPYKLEKIIVKAKRPITVCGVCYGIMDLEIRDLNYCPCCGQAIDWSEVENEIENDD